MKFTANIKKDTVGNYLLILGMFMDIVKCRKRLYYCLVICFC